MSQALGKRICESIRKLISIRESINFSQEIDSLTSLGVRNYIILQDRAERNSQGC